MALYNKQKSTSLVSLTLWRSRLSSSSTARCFKLLSFFFSSFFSSLSSRRATYGRASSLSPLVPSCLPLRNGFRALSRVRPMRGAPIRSPMLPPPSSSSSSSSHVCALATAWEKKEREKRERERDVGRSPPFYCPFLFKRERERKGRRRYTVSLISSPISYLTRAAARRILTTQNPRRAAAAASSAGISSS